MSYAGAPTAPDAEPRHFDLRDSIGPLLAVAGAIAAIVGSQLTWATLKLVGQVSTSGGNSQDSEHITYPGIVLLEGRITLVLGVCAVVLSVLTLLRGRWAAALIATGAAGVVTALLAAIEHPVELSTLFRSYGTVDPLDVHLPNGPGVWLALGGAVLILVGGLVRQLWRDPVRGAPVANEQFGG